MNSSEFRTNLQKLISKSALGERVNKLEGKMVMLMLSYMHLTYVAGLKYFVCIRALYLKQWARFAKRWGHFWTRWMIYIHH
jgi:hypothetical protein